MARDKNSVGNTILWISLRTLINMLLVFILVEGFVLGYQWSYKLFADEPYIAGATGSVTLEIGEGTSAKEIAALLETDGVVENKYLFLARTYLGKYQTRFQAGSYRVGPGMSPDEICRKICGIQSEDAS